VTRVTVSDRQAPPAPAPYGTQMARRPVMLNVVPLQGSYRSACCCQAAGRTTDQPSDWLDKSGGIFTGLDTLLHRAAKFNEVGEAAL
jgi:hypothetical protein